MPKLIIEVRHVPSGKVLAASIPQEVDLATQKQLLTMVTKELNNLAYFAINTDYGKVIIPPNLLQDSIITIYGLDPSLE